MADLSQLPQVDAVLRDADAEPVVRTYGRRPFTRVVREIIDEARAQAKKGAPIPRRDEIITTAAMRLEDQRARRLRRVVNATGVVVHTNLGRAPLSGPAREAMAEAAGYCSLEYDLAEGRRGSRTRHLGDLAAEACDAEAATVVNNGAAALVLVLAALSTGKEALVSRGELVEIGGSFRLPDIMSATGAILREVGTTNRTKLEDYRARTGDETGMLLKVHRSNYRVVGFTTEVTARDLAGVADEAGVPFVYDLGSGLLRDVDLDLPERDLDGFAAEPSAASALAEGADLVIFSGDKLLGGPQAGIIAGRGDLVMRCDRHPLARALRVDKFRRGALEATLESHLRADVPADVPVWAMLTVDLETLRSRAEGIASRVGDPATARKAVSLTGGGSLPGTELDSWAVHVRVDDPDGLAAALRRHEPPVIARVEGGAVWLDVRTVPPVHDNLVADALSGTLERFRSG